MFYVFPLGQSETISQSDTSLFPTHFVILKEQIVLSDRSQVWLCQDDQTGGGQVVPLSEQQN